MAQPLIVALPPNLQLSEGDQVLVSAVRADNGADVGGVTVQAISLFVSTDNPDDLAYGPFLLVTGPGG